MNTDKFKNDLMIGETSSIEFKRCGNEVEHDVFESICAFLNRFGGDVYLGVLNDGTVVGVNARNAAAMMKNIVNVAGNPNVFKPSGFFREIGRADRLGSGVRNLYKYCKDYGGADPVFTEGNTFVISVSLKKLDPIRFPFEKQPIETEKPHIGDEKPHIESQKPHIGDEKPHIGDEKPHIDGKLTRLGLTHPTEENIIKLFRRFGLVDIFGRKEVRDTTGLQDRASSALIAQMLRHRLLDTVKGHGKGKYRFRSEI